MGQRRLLRLAAVCGLVVAVVVAAMSLLLGGSHATMAWALMWFVLACVTFVLAPMRLALPHCIFLLFGPWVVILAPVFWL